MSNPFPGVNPYIESERFWEDFHRTFINYVREALFEQLPDGYDARVDERVSLMDPYSSGLVRQPDVSIVESPTAMTAAPVSRSGSTAVAVHGPTATIELPNVVEVRDVWIEIRDLVDESLVTSIEILSPTNKEGEGYAIFQQKRFSVLAGHANVVDIDLLLHGRRARFAKPLPPGDLYAFVTRPAIRLKADVYAWRVVDRLPVLPIPLRSPEPDLSLDLQTVYQTAFDRGRFARRLRYDKPLASGDASLDAWAKGVIGAAKD